MSVFYDLNKTPRNILNQAIVRAIVSENDGAWFDPSDLSTLYQDASGTIPVTAVEQPVGLMLDKSQGMMLGPEFTPTVYSGTTDTTGLWTIQPTIVRRNGDTTTFAALTLGSGIVAGKFYKVTFTISNKTGDDVIVRVGGGAGDYARLSSGESSAVLKAGGSEPVLFFAGYDGTTGTADITNISVRELYGNHATQSVTASRPVLSARYNLLTKTEDFSDAVWAKTNSVVTQNEQKSGRLFDKIVSSSVGGNVSYLCHTGVIANSTFAFSLDIYSEQEKQITIRIKGNGATTEAVNYTLNLIVGINSINISKSFTSAAGGSNILLIIYTGLIDTNFGTIWVDAADLRRGTTSPYQRVNTATDYDTNPALFPKYLKFDGVDDYLNLPFMNLYAGGEMSIIAARNAVSQSTDTYIISERSTTDADPKYFPSRQLASGGNMDAYIADDAAAVVLDTTGSAFGGAADKVIRSVVDTGSNIKLYKNGGLAADDNYTRAGTLTLNNTTLGASVSTTTGNYAAMKLYSLIITKSALTDAQRIKCERFLARKAGVML